MIIHPFITEFIKTNKVNIVFEEIKEKNICGMFNPFGEVIIIDPNKSIYAKENLDRIIIHELIHWSQIKITRNVTFDTDTCFSEEEFLAYWCEAEISCYLGIMSKEIKLLRQKNMKKIFKIDFNSMIPLVNEIISFFIGYQYNEIAI